MAFISSSFSNRKLQDRRYTTNQIGDAQEAFTSVLSIGSNEIFTDTRYIPTSSLPFSGSSQDGLIVSASVVDPSLSGENDLPIAKYWFQKKLTPGSTAVSNKYETWFFLTGSLSNTSEQLIHESQVTNFLSPKFGGLDISLANAENNPAGYNVRVYITSNDAQPGDGGSGAVEAANYVFDYKTGVLSFVNNSVAPGISQYVWLSAYQYVGRTLQSQISDGTLGGSGGGEGFPFEGNAVITGSLLVSGSSPTVIVTGSIEVTNGITGSLYGTSSFAEGLVPELFEIPEINITGSGLVVSSSSLPSNTHNAIRIGGTELVDGVAESFLINMPHATSWAFSGSNGPISNFRQDAFIFYGPSPAYYNFKSDSDSFIIYKSGSIGTAVSSEAFKVNRQNSNTTISGSLRIISLPEEDTLTKVVTTDADGNLAYTSSAYFASSTSLTNLTLTVGANSISIDNLTSATSSYITEAETGSMLEPYLLSAQTQSGFNGLVIDDDSGGGDLTVRGNLYVYGEATELQVSNLRVEDRFILLNSGSVGGIHEGGIVVQTDSSGSGSALFYEESTNRWMIAQSSSVGSNDTNITVSGTIDYIVTVSASTAPPTGAPPNFGNGDNNTSVGQMYVDTAANDIYIYA